MPPLSIYTRYAKRVAVATLYKSSELYMLTDYSSDLEDTKDFVERRVKDLKRLGVLD